MDTRKHHSVKPASKEEALNLDEIIDYLRKFWRRKWLILLGGLIGLIIGWGISTQVKPVFTATSEILINPKDITGGLEKEGGELEDLQNLSMQAAIINSPAIINEVIKKYNLEKLDPFSNVISPVELFRKYLGIKINSSSRTILISFTFYRPDIAALIANGIAETFLYSGIARTSGSQAEDIEALENQIPKLTDRLEESRAKIKAFTQKNPEVMSYVVMEQQMGRLNEELIDLNTRRINIETSTADLERYLTEGGDPFMHPAIRSKESIAEKLQQLHEAEVLLLELKQEYREKHPKVMDANSKIASLKRSLDIEKSKAIDNLREELSTVDARLETIKNAISDIKGRLTEMSPKISEYNKYLNEELTTVELIENINQRIIEKTLSADMKRPGVEILARAEIPISADQKKMVVVLAGFGIGCLVIGVLIFLKDQLDTSLHSPDDVDNIVGKPCLGIIPHVKVQKDTFQPLFKKRRYEILFKDSLSFIRTNINFVLSDTEERVLLFTSSITSEGKSFFVYQLAQSFASQGKKTLLLDADLRKSVLKYVFPPKQEEESKDLDRYLVGKAEINDIIEKTDIENLDFIRSGHVQYNVPEALGSEKMKSLIHELKARYEVVLIDAPPVIPVNDVLSLANWVDDIVLIVKGGKTHRRIVDTCITKLSRRNIPILGVILTQVKQAEKGQYYYYYYYYSEEGADRRLAEKEEKDKKGKKGKTEEKPAD